MAAPADEELLAAVLEAKAAHPDFGLARLRAHLKEANGWELSEKRVKKALAEGAGGSAAPAASGAGTGAAGNPGAAGGAGGSGGTAVAGTWVAERPTPRGYFSLTAVQPGDAACAAGVALFGGEIFDNSKNLFYNQLYLLDVASRWLPHPRTLEFRTRHSLAAGACSQFLAARIARRNAPPPPRAGIPSPMCVCVLSVDGTCLASSGWARFSEGNGPPARSAHQACVCGGYYWVFGGEFSSPTGNKFKLMDDLWRMPLSEAGGMAGGKWQRVGAGADAPGPRSGHRMVAVGDKLVLYGGMGESKYYSDLHVWDVTRGAWISKMVKMQQMKLGASAKTPGPRGGFAMWPDGDAALYVWGGTRDKGRNESEYLDDLWRLDLATWAWERVKPEAGTGPGVRSGPAVAVVGADKRKVVFFGGVTDVEEEGGARSKPRQVFLSDMHCYDMDTRSWSTANGAGAEAALAAGMADAAKDAAGSKPTCPGPRRNAQAVFVPSSSSLLVVGGLRDERTQGAAAAPCCPVRCSCPVPRPLRELSPPTHVCARVRQVVAKKKSSRLTTFGKARWYVLQAGPSRWQRGLAGTALQGPSGTTAPVTRRTAKPTTGKNSETRSMIQFTGLGAGATVLRVRPGGGHGGSSLTGTMAPCYYCSMKQTYV